jgi:uncharacterized membrane protein YdfJ with MMPL/SSD domain
LLPTIFSSTADIHDVSIAIRDAVAPVFLLTGIGSILGVLVNRLSRSIDRARAINAMNDAQFFKFADELDIIVKRTKWMRWSVGLFIFAGFCVAISIASVFISVELRLNLTHFVLITFIAAMLSLTVGLLCFLREIILASKEVITSNRQIP